MVATNRKLAPHVKKKAAVVPAPLRKRPRPEAEIAGDAPQPKKRVKKLAKKGSGKFTLSPAKPREQLLLVFPPFSCC